MRKLKKQLRIFYKGAYKVRLPIFISKRFIKENSNSIIDDVMAKIVEYTNMQPINEADRELCEYDKRVCIHHCQTILKGIRTL